MEQESKNKGDVLVKKRKSPLVLTVAYILLAVAVVTIFVLCFYLVEKNNDLKNEIESLRVAATSEETTSMSEEPKTESTTIQLTFEYASFDPCGFMDDNYVFDKTPNHFITGLKKGIDYSVSDSYGGSGLRTYIIYPDHSYMGAGANNTSIGFTAKNEKSSIDSVTYFFNIDRNNAERILNRIYNDVSKTCGVFLSCAGKYQFVKKSFTLPVYSNGLLPDNPEKEVISVDEAIDFKKLVACVANSYRGTYNVCWDTKGYEITLNINTDTKSSTFEGSVCISTIK